MSKKKQIILSDDNNLCHDALGITCSESEFQLSLIINSILSVKLTVASPIKKNIKGSEFSFPTFYFDTENSLELKLIKNKSNHQVLFSSQKIYDYIIILKGNETLSFAKIFIDKLKHSSEITLINHIQIEKIGKPKQLNLFFN